MKSDDKTFGLFNRFGLTTALTPALSPRRGGAGRQKIRRTIPANIPIRLCHEV
jgi:hypothetical protein